ncbi:hypothetical protein PI95_013585 [Hassallia byssoidea VB512170]|uniref:Uncharacterized protein n=1 Tax=Hassallia byssoidea VB512170 TaxID=1304833 RepID=A0A846H7F8_9CYAN|nr:hypothetical protein [Hassalia byssoidea]NEU73567.1 hypothetical protein [Hassalia byssoidea VB512170]
MDSCWWIVVGCWASGIYPPYPHSPTPPLPTPYSPLPTPHSPSLLSLAKDVARLNKNY